MNDLKKQEVNMNDFRIERDINTGKLTVVKCEASFICKADLVHKFVNQVNTLIDQNAILERELAEAQNILKQCPSIMSDTSRNNEVMKYCFGDDAEFVAVKHYERLQRELAEAKAFEESRLKSTQFNFQRYQEAAKQRDTLVEALHSIRHRLGDFQEPWNSRETDIDAIAQQAIATVEGGEM